MKDKPKIIAVVGPTASGKSNIAIRLALDLGGEILSCDSMQIYKGMDIGTAKPTLYERELVPHRLIDIAAPSDEFSCADYKAAADNALASVLSNGAVPIFCGGTGLYLDSVISVNKFSPDIPIDIREMLETKDSEELWNELIEVDPEAASLTHINNRKRVIRALEIYHGTGKTKTEWDRLSLHCDPPYNALIIGLDYKDRSILYDRIERRVDAMISEGLIDEVKALKGCLSETSAQAIGYKELILYLDGILSLDEAIRLLKKNTRNYAKRQLTWFKRNKQTIWFYPDESRDETYGFIKKAAEEFISSSRKEQQPDA